eukprot:11774773-Prorocentrum_lima.AAC.1
MATTGTQYTTQPLAVQIPPLVPPELRAGQVTGEAETGPEPLFRSSSLCICLSLKLTDGSSPHFTPVGYQNRQLSPFAWYLVGA